MPLVSRSANHTPDLNVTLCAQAKTTHIGLCAVFRAPENTLIQRLIRLSNIKFAELNRENDREFHYS
jgi:hypothetical protein